MARTRVRWGRVGSAAGLVALVVALLSSRAGAGPAQRLPHHTYLVRVGDTVWSIARRSVGPTGDPRPMVDVVIRENRLRDAEVFPGERLLLPSPAEVRPSSG